MRIPILNIDISRSKPTAVDLPVAAPTTKSFLQDTASVTLPVRGGRESEPERVGLLTSLKTEFNLISSDTPTEYLEWLELLARFNGDLSYAVDNIVQLGNTDYNISFNDDVSPEMARKMMYALRFGDEKIYNGGTNSLINDLLAQAAINGCISGEIIPMGTLEDVEKVALVPPKTIKFAYDDKSRDYQPFQDISLFHGVIKESTLIKLNTVTYKYYALRRFSEKPYGIPPFLSALDSITIEKSMVDNLKNIVGKLGLLGFLSVLMTAPKKQQGEDDNTYAARMQSYLTSVEPEARKGFAHGMVVGFKGIHEFDMQSTTANVQGAVDLFNLVSQFKMAGLKQDPLMLGRNFNVAETMAKVVLEKLKTQIRNYQKVVASFLQDIYTMRLLMQGYKFKFVKVEFAAPMVGDQLKVALAREKELENLRSLYADGIISQLQRAHEAGYEEPDKPEPRLPVIPTQAVSKVGTAKDKRTKKPRNPDKPLKETKIGK